VLTIRETMLFVGAEAAWWESRGSTNEQRRKLGQQRREENELRLFTYGELSIRGASSKALCSALTFFCLLVCGRFRKESVQSA